MTKTILLVDDDAHILDTAKDILETDDYHVLTAETGAAALEGLNDQNVDLMIVDFNLLDTTGVELAVKAKALRPPLVIVLMTGEVTVDLGPAQGLIHAVLTKPVDPPQMMALIRQALL